MRRCQTQKQICRSRFVDDRELEQRNFFLTSAVVSSLRLCRSVDLLQNSQRISYADNCFDLRVKEVNLRHKILTSTFSSTIPKLAFRIFKLLCCTWNNGEPSHVEHSSLQDNQRRHAQ